MAQYITKIRTKGEDLQIDYNALANKPTVKTLGAAPAQHPHSTNDISDFPTSLPANGGNADTVGNKHASDFAPATDFETVKSDVNTMKSDVGTIQSNVEAIQKSMDEASFDMSSVTATTEELNYVKGVTSDIQTQLDNKAALEHEHSTDDITSGVLPISRGGIGSEDGAEGLKNLLAAGYMILSPNQFGDELPTDNSVETIGRIFFKKVT